ncbi:MAG: hypothetical protein LBQ28_10185 [Prevotellaceae bacterium]|jgi:hypothetical protein|nr:hypothetical protein [Prevotellaceae bacterium]
MKSFKKLLIFMLFAMIVFHCAAQDDKSQMTPREVLAKCYSASSDFNYDAVKECFSQRNVAYVDVVKQKIEDPKMKFQKGLISAAIQTAQYDILEENISDSGKSATLKTKVSVMDQTFTADVVFIVENNKWKIDNVPNAKDIPNQIPILQLFIK